MLRIGCSTKEILIPGISATDPGDFSRNVGHKTGANTYEFEINPSTTIATFAYSAMSQAPGASVNGCFVGVGTGLVRIWAAPEADAVPGCVFCARGDYCRSWLFVYRTGAGGASVPYQGRSPRRSFLVWQAPCGAQARRGYGSARRYSQAVYRYEHGQPGSWPLRGPVPAGDHAL